jgi:RNA polymerase sigma-70 factor (ECF subfamily)
MRNGDQALIRAVLAGDKDAYGVLVERHGESMFRVAFRITESEPDAEEIAQEAFLRGYRSLADFDARADFRTWIYRIAVNCALQVLQKRKSEAVMGFSWPTPEPGPRDSCWTGRLNTGGTRPWRG